MAAGWPCARASRARRRHVARPMPLAAPVTSTFMEASRRWSPAERHGPGQQVAIRRQAAEVHNSSAPTGACRRAVDARSGGRRSREDTVSARKHDRGPGCCGSPWRIRPYTPLRLRVVATVPWTAVGVNAQTRVRAVRRGRVHVGSKTGWLVTTTRRPTATAMGDGRIGPDVAGSCGAGREATGRLSRAYGEDRERPAGCARAFASQRLAGAHGPGGLGNRASQRREPSGLLESADAAAPDAKLRREVHLAAFDTATRTHG
jgi:hypothetical protein